MSETKVIPTIAAARRRAMEERDLPASLPDVRQPLRPAPPATYQRALPPISIADAEAEPPAEAVFPESAPAPQAPRSTQTLATVTLSTTIQHRGRQITISATGMTADQFCDILNRRGFAAAKPAAQPTAPLAMPDDLPDGWRLCSKHHAPMRPRNKQGDNWHSHNVGTTENPIWCKGYKGADSPGYEL